MLISDIRQPQLQATGPPGWANAPVRVAPMVVDSVADLRKIELAPSEMDRPQSVLLTGEFSAYDGYLQGFYLKYPPDRSRFVEDGAGNIYSNDGKICWRKLT